MSINKIQGFKSVVETALDVNYSNIRGIGVYASIDDSAAQKSSIDAYMPVIRKNLTRNWEKRNTCDP